MPPPAVFAVLPEMVELEMLRVPRPKLLKPPPLPEVFAPVTVTPEMERLPPVMILKILKLPWLASMVSEEAPGPVMVRVPALTMAGSEEPRVMVPATLKSMISSPAVALAKVIASLSEIKVSPELTISKVVSTVIVAGLILSSNRRSSNLGEPEALRAFRFWELPKSLRKAFKSI